MAQICARANGELGKNAEDRKRNLQVALGQGLDYLQALDTVRRWEQRTEHLQALIDAQTDIRRRDRWAIRARLVDALLALGASGEAPDPHTEAPFDDTLDHSTLQRPPARQWPISLTKICPCSTPRSGREPPMIARRQLRPAGQPGQLRERALRGRGRGCRRQRREPRSARASRRSRPSASARLPTRARRRAAPRGVAIAEQRRRAQSATEEPDF